MNPSVQNIWRTDLIRKSLLILIALLTLPSAAEEQLTSAALRRLGVNTERLQPIVFSHNDKMLAAFDRGTFEQKKEGVFYRLWIFEIGPDGTLGEARSFPLSLKTFQQGEFTPDDSQFVVLGDRGTTFYSIDLKKNEVRDVMVPEWGKPGFRADPTVLWSEAGKLFVIGHPYDENRFIETQTVATLRPDAEPSERFKRNRDVGSLERGLERLWFRTYLTDSSGFFGQKYPQLTILSFWDGERVSEFDRAFKFSGFWSNAGRLLYSARRGEGMDSELTLYDAKTDEKKVLATDPEDYRYLFLSRNGQTVLTSQVSETPGRLIPWYAKESEGWQLKPVVADSSGEARTLASGWMRLSSSGNLMAHIGPTGLTLYELP